jgi:hypothetical protein
MSAIPRIRDPLLADIRRSGIVRHHKARVTYSGLELRRRRNLPDSLHDIFDVSPVSVSLWITRLDLCRRHQVALNLNLRPWIRYQSHDHYPRAIRWNIAHGPGADFAVVVLCLFPPQG